jgi:hypothetical protein
MGPRAGLDTVVKRKIPSRRKYDVGLWNGINCLRIRFIGRYFCEGGIETSGPIKAGIFLHQLRNYQIF